MATIFNILVIANSYLDPNAPVSIVERSFIHSIKSDHNNITVLCAGNKSQNLFQNNIQVVTFKESYLIRTFFRIIQKLKLYNLAFSPDQSYYSWFILNRQKFLNFCKINKFDYILSISNPPTDHLISNYIKKHLGIPWIALFFDPWFDNPYRPITSRKAIRKDFQREKIVASNADLILHNNNVILKEWSDRYGKDVKNKMAVVPMPSQLNCNFQGKLTTRKKDSHKIIISHIGNFYNDRNSEPFLRALHLLFERNSALKEQLSINFIGYVTARDKKLIQQLHLNKVVNCLGFLSEKDCISYYNESDAFLVIDADNGKNIFFPSKIIKYFYFNKPIIGITPTNSVLEYELSESHHRYFRHNQIHEICQYLEDLIEGKSDIYEFEHDYWKKFSPENVKFVYDNIINNFFSKK